MFPIILTKENWATGKARLHAALPAIRSSHLAEAIAAGFHARQHASLIPQFEPNDRGHHALVLGEEIRFIRRLADFGYEGIPFGVFRGAFTGTTLPHPIYALFKRGDIFGNESHYLLCSRYRRPMMMVKMARVYAELEWDCVTVDSEEDNYLRHKAGDQLIRIMYNLFQQRVKGAPGKPFFEASAFTGTIIKLLPATAMQLAEDYFRLLYGPLAESQPGIEPV